VVSGINNCACGVWCQRNKIISVLSQMTCGVWCQRNKIISVLSQMTENDSFGSLVRVNN
jgi:hypothetical protein